MKDLKKILEEAAKRLDGRYERTEVTLENEQEGEPDDSIIWVKFNASLDNTLGVYPLPNGKIEISNYSNLGSDYFKSTGEWSESKKVNNTDELLDFFHHCYERLAGEQEKFKNECKGALEAAHMEWDGTIMGEPWIPVGKLIEHRGDGI